MSKGAKVLAGGQIPKEGVLAEGSFYPPTVLADVPENANIAQEEIFGPIMCIFKVHSTLTLHPFCTSSDVDSASIYVP